MTRSIHNRPLWKYVKGGEHYWELWRRYRELRSTVITAKTWDDIQPIRKQLVQRAANEDARFGGSNGR